MVKIGIMQPYFFPYIGYWQLINAVDTFVIYDNVNYIKRGYINRNSILINGKSHLLSLEVLKASPNKYINNLLIGNNKRKILKTIEYAYKKSPFFDTTYPMLKKIILNESKNLADYLSYSLLIIAKNIGIDTKIIRSSDFSTSKSKAQEKVIEICKEQSADCYINSAGGQHLYFKERFKNEGLELKFLKGETTQYKQYKNTFIPNLSIIDVMMFNEPLKVRNMLDHYYLI